MGTICYEISCLLIKLNAKKKPEKEVENFNEQIFQYLLVVERTKKIYINV